MRARVRLSLSDIYWKRLIVLIPGLGGIMLFYLARADVCQAPFLSALEIRTHFSLHCHYLSPFHR